MARLERPWPQGLPILPSDWLLPAGGGSPLRTAAAAPGTIESSRRKHTLSLESKNVFSPPPMHALSVWSRKDVFLFFLQMCAFTGLCR